MTSTDTPDSDAPKGDPSGGDTPGMGDVDDLGQDREVDLDEVVAILATMGVDAVVEQTGGGCATIHADPTRPHPFEPDTLAYAAVAGPGRYGWGRRPSIADLTDFYVGPDDCGESRATEAWPVGARDAAEVARLIAEQTTHPERPATDAELRAAGFDPTQARVARERRASLAARWHPPVPADGPGEDDTAGGMVVAEQLVTAAVENGALRVGVYVAATDIVDFGTGDGELSGDCVPMVLEVEGQVVFSLDESGRATLYGSAATNPEAQP